MLRKNQPKDLLRNIKTPTACGGSTKTPKILKGTNPGTLTIKGGSLVDTSMRMNTQRQVVEIKVGYTYSRIVTPKEAIALAAKEFSAFARNAQYQTLYQRGLWDGRYSMVNKKDGSFGTGMLADIKAYLEHEIGATIELTDLREVPPSSYSFEWLFDKPLREAQVGALEKLNSNTGGIIRMVTGSGKCWSAGTPIMMYDGSVKPVEDIKTGDVLMGDDGTPRNVLSTSVGYGPMYRVTPTKGDPYTVNDEHILSLKYTKGHHFGKKQDLLDITVKEYLKLSKSHKHVLKGYRRGVDHFGGETETLPVPPYLMGAWLGDGSRHFFVIHNPDKEVHDAIHAICKDNNVKVQSAHIPNKVDQIRIYHPTKTDIGAIWWGYITNAGLRERKFIPHIYKTASLQDRLEILAGLIDTDGHLDRNSYDIIFKYRELAEDLTFIARSVGLAAYCKPCTKTCTNSGPDKHTRVSNTYYRVSISGNTAIIPCRVQRKIAEYRKQKKDVLVTGIKVEYVGEDNYYGFVIDGNRRLLMGDFTVAHNTMAFSKLIQERGMRTLVCVPSKELLYQTAEVLNSNIGGKDFKLGLLGDGHWPDERSTVVIAMYQSLVSLHGKTPEERAQFIETMGSFDMLICDECHKVCSNDSITKTWETIMDINTYYRYGFSATPFEKKGTVAEMLQRSAFGKIIYDMNMTEAREAGYVTPFTVYMLKPEYPRELTRQGTTGMTWNEAHDYYIGNNATRNDAVVQAVGLLLKDNRKVMVVAQRIQHNELLAKMFAETYGEDNVYLLHGQLDSTYRKKSMSEFKARKTPCIMVASSVGNDGIDIPDIDGLVLAHGGKSFFQNVQRTGRGLRSAQGKKDLVFIDFNDAALGRWFQNHTKKRVEYYQDLGAKVVFA